LQYSVGCAQGPGADTITEIQFDQMAANGPVKVVVFVVWELASHNIQHRSIPMCLVMG